MGSRTDGQMKSWMGKEEMKIGVERATDRVVSQLLLRLLGPSQLGRIFYFVLFQWSHRNNESIIN